MSDIPPTEIELSSLLEDWPFLRFENVDASGWLEDSMNGSHAPSFQSDVSIFDEDMAANMNLNATPRTPSEGSDSETGSVAEEDDETEEQKTADVNAADVVVARRHGKSPHLAAVTSAAKRSVAKPKAKRSNKTQAKTKKPVAVVFVPVPASLPEAINETWRIFIQGGSSAKSMIGRALAPTLRFLIEEIRARRMTQDQATERLKTEFPQWNKQFFDGFMTKVCKGVHMKCHLGEFEPLKERARASAPKRAYNRVQQGDALWHEIFTFWLAQNGNISVKQLAEHFNVSRGVMHRIVNEQFIRN